MWRHSGWAGLLAGAALLIGQTEDARIFVDYRVVMIPMRDGARLETAILTPRNARCPTVPDRSHTLWDTR
jgi:predicted acyl esterase